MSNEWSLDLLPGDASDEEIDAFVEGLNADDEDEGEGENAKADGEKAVSAHDSRFR